MVCCAPTSRKVRGQRWLMIAAALMFAVNARAETLRIVSYNIDSSDQGSDNNITGPSHSLPTVVQAIGLHHIGTNAQPMDVMGVEELNSTTLSNFVTQLNSIYGAGAYTFDPTADPNTGGGPDGLIYNTHTVQVISARALPTGNNVLLQSNGTYTAAHNIAGVKNVPRAPMLYELRPVGYGPSADFYMYVSHALSGDNPSGDARYAEAQELRSDAKYNLPTGAHIIYSGDFNLFNGSGENAYKTLTGQATSDGINWGDSSAIWANANSTTGFDPTSKTNPPTNTTFLNSSADGNATYLYTDATDSGSFTNSSRLDIQLLSKSMYSAYGSTSGLQLAADTSDPFDTLSYPSAQYPYAFEVFGNNGSLPRGSVVTTSSNTSLNDLSSTALSPSTVLNDMIRNSTAKTGSDHYPIVGDYNLVGLTPDPRFYVGGATGNWNTTGNWSASDHGTSGSSIPINGTIVTIDPSSNTTVTFDTSYTGAGVGDVHINGVSGATATLKQTGNTLNVAGSLFLGESANTKGAYTMTGGTLAITGALSVGGNATSAGGSGQFNQNGGSVSTPILRVWTGGTVTITSGSFSAGATTISGGAVTVASSENLGSIAMTSGLATISGAGTVLTATSLTMSSPAKLDVTSDKLIINYTGSSPVASIRQLLVSGFNGGSWDGAGIDSSTAHANAFFNTALGYNDTGNSIVVKYTNYGDNNLDGVVNTADFQMFLDGLVATSGSSWSQGDYTYDGRVDLGNDFNLFLRSYLTQGGALGDLAPMIVAADQLSAAQKGQLLAVVPEPNCAAITALAAAGLRRRRRR
jgi:hypothetical protein